MFSPATRKSHLGPHPPRNETTRMRRNSAAAASAGGGRLRSSAAVAEPDSPSTPSPLAGETNNLMEVIPNRPTTGTSVPWSSRLSVLARLAF